MTTQNSTKRYGVSQWGVAHKVAQDATSECGKPLRHIDDAGAYSLAEYAANLHGKPPIEVCPECSA